MQVYKYKNYAEYIETQKQGYEKKFYKIWACEENIKYLCEYLNCYSLNKNKEIKKGLCHGVRRGAEVRWFNQYLKCEMIGTELGGSVEKYIINWDFNKEKIEWNNNFDFIYSNSFDHSFNPAETLQVWARQIKSDGIIFLEYDKRQEHTGEISKPCNKLDCVSITVKELIESIPRWLKNNYAKIEILDMPVIKYEFQKTIAIHLK